MSDGHHLARPKDGLVPPASEQPLGEGNMQPGDGGGLFSNLVRRTDNDYRGITDKSLIGQDMPDDERDDDQS